MRTNLEEVRSARSRILVSRRRKALGSPRSGKLQTLAIAKELVCLRVDRKNNNKMKLRSPEGHQSSPNKGSQQKALTSLNSQGSEKALQVLSQQTWNHPSLRHPDLPAVSIQLQQHMAKDEAKSTNEAFLRQKVQKFDQNYHL